MPHDNLMYCALRARARTRRGGCSLEAEQNIRDCIVQFPTASQIAPTHPPIGFLCTKAASPFHNAV
jgi:hypothetical protein